ncbi:MAG: TatD family hydrolase [Betaproteobacteria bacterium]
MVWIDTHCHLDASEFAHDQDAMRSRARAAGVQHCVIPAVAPTHFSAVRQLAHRFGDSYALGIHPLYVADVTDRHLVELEQELRAHRSDPRLVALGEIGLDFFVPALCTPAMRVHQERIYRQQLLLARRLELPVILHVRRSADRLLKHLRELAPAAGWHGIAHAFNGSVQQAHAFVELGFKLGFGGALTFPAARQLQHLATTLPMQALVLETDAPDIPPQWLYRSAAERAGGLPQGRNEPAELPRIALQLAQLRGLALPVLAEQLHHNALAALPGLSALLDPTPATHPA